MSANVENMFYVSEPPWHGLGKGFLTNQRDRHYWFLDFRNFGQADMHIYRQEGGKYG